MRTDDSYQPWRMVSNSLVPYLPGVVAIFAGILAGVLIAGLIAYLSTGSALGNPGSQLYSGETPGVGAVLASIYVVGIGIFVLLRNEQSLQWAASVGGTEMLARATGCEAIGLLWVGLFIVWMPIGVLNLVQTQVKPPMWFAVCALLTAGLVVAWRF